MGKDKAARQKRNLGSARGQIAPPAQLPLYPCADYANGYVLASERAMRARARRRLRKETETKGA